MGQDNSLPLPPTYQGFNYCSISFCGYDTIRLIPAVNSKLINSIQSAVQRHWVGIQSEAVDETGRAWYDIKLKGTPFKQSGTSYEALITRRMGCQILANLYALGWRLITTTDLSRVVSKTTWIFKHEEFVVDDYATQLRDVCCLSISSYGTIQLINASDRLRRVVLQACQSVYHSGVNEINELSEAGDLSVNLSGSPWCSTKGPSLVEGKFLILEIIKYFSQFGYQLYATFNVKDTADSLLFINHFQEQPIDLMPNCFMVISLDKCDRLRFLHYNEEIIAVSRRVINREWPKQITRELDKYGSWEFQLGGSPWMADYGPKAIASRRTIMRLLQHLEQIGWRVLYALDLSRSLTDKSTFIFQSCTPANKEYICLAPMLTKLLTVIGCNHHHDNELKRCVIGALERSYPLGIKRITAVDHDAVEINFHGKPWDSSLGNFNHSRYMMTHLLKAMNDAGWTLMTSCDTSGNVHYDNDHNPDYSLDVHSWIFSRELTH